MKIELLSILECPFCGQELRAERNRALVMENADLLAGILYCSCCAFPVVDGIPYLRTGRLANEATRLLEEGRREDARNLLLGLDGSRLEQFRLTEGRGVTFRSLLEILNTDAEGEYLLYRFSDPTYLAGIGLLNYLGSAFEIPAGPMLDVGGGAGHYARHMSRMAPGQPVFLVDLVFWKLWLGKHFVAPTCLPICCDANQPLPFTQSSMSMVFSSDAFHYVWHRRLLASEMIRSMGDGGVLALTHLHHAGCENPSAGMPLYPAGYRHLFAAVDPQLFIERKFLDSLVKQMPMGLLSPASDNDLRDEATLALIANAKPTDTSVLDIPVHRPHATKYVLNPLYRCQPGGAGSHYKLVYPSPEYGEEFGAQAWYLPPEVELTPAQALAIREGHISADLEPLAKQHVLLDLPPRYL